ncbi:unnamed protein product [Lathyrus oleraceus]
MAHLTNFYPIHTLLRPIPPTPTLNPKTQTLAISLRFRHVTIATSSLSQSLPRGWIYNRVKFGELLNLS